MSATRTIEINDLTPAEMAKLFAKMGSDDQAAFFATVWDIAKEWPGAGWCQQSRAIAEQADEHPGARDAIRTLASHLPAEDLAWIAVAGADA